MVNGLIQNPLVNYQDPKYPWVPKLEYLRWSIFRHINLLGSKSVHTVTQISGIRKAWPQDTPVERVLREATERFHTLGWKAVHIPLFFTVRCAGSFTKATQCNHLRFTDCGFSEPRFSRISHSLLLTIMIEPWKSSTFYERIGVMIQRSPDKGFCKRLSGGVS